MPMDTTMMESCYSLIPSQMQGKNLSAIENQKFQNLTPSHNTYDSHTDGGGVDNECSKTIESQ